MRILKLVYRMALDHLSIICFGDWEYYVYVLDGLLLQQQGNIPITIIVIKMVWLNSLPTVLCVGWYCQNYESKLLFFKFLWNAIIVLFNCRQISRAVLITDQSVLNTDAEQQVCINFVSLTSLWIVCINIWSLVGFSSCFCFCLSPAFWSALSADNGLIH